MEANEREGKRSKVRALIVNATDSTVPEVDPRLLTAIKTVVRYSDFELRIAARTLLDLMKRKHSQVRFLSLLIIDELFMRSKLFRSLVVDELDFLLTLSVGFRRDEPLPDPPAVATRLRSNAIEFLEKWNDSFGVHYRRIRLGFEYLKNTLRLQFPNLQANAARLRREREERERNTKKILLAKFESLKQDFGSVKEEIEATVKEIGECLDIARGGREEPFYHHEEEEEEGVVEFGCSALRQIRMSALEEGEKVRETSENEVIFDALRELYKLVVTKHLVTVREWISVLIRVDLADNKCRDSLLKEFIVMKNDLQSAKNECEQEGFSLQRNTKNTEQEEEEEEEDFWEEGKIGISESGNKKDTGVVKPTVRKRLREKILGREDRLKRSESNPSRVKLLAEAPVVDWGSQLDNWDGSKRMVLANQRGLDVEGHWGRVDYDAVIPAEKVAELNVQASVYKENQSETPPCRAPLKRGGLCLRRDSGVCIFHGVIVPRDDHGKPLIDPKDALPGPQVQEVSCTSGDDLVKQLPRQAVNNVQDGDGKDRKKLEIGQKDPAPGLQVEEVSFTTEEDLLKQLARQAVRNVRERDERDRKKTKMDERALKRAKLARVREHNASVLKEAALVSTSRSANIGENNTEASTSGRNKKQGLSSMLKKRVTPKDRISKRLSKARTNETTVIQLSLGDDANYREAFPNQW